MNKFMDLFPKGRFYNIPNYQRPYAWEKTHIEQFFSDLEGYSQEYYLGHFLLYENKKEERYDIIDGQQRLTTALLLIMASIQELPEKKDMLVKTYIIDKSNRKLKTEIADDDDFLSELFREKLTSDFKPKSLAQEKIYEALKLFKNKIKNKTPDEIDSILNVLLESNITIGTIPTRQLSNQVFIFHNSRGKKLTDLENIKSLLIERSYQFGSADSFIKDSIDKPFKETYALLYEIKKLLNLNEDNIIGYFFSLFYNKSFAFTDFQNNLSKPPYHISTSQDIEAFVNQLKGCITTVKNILTTAETNNTVGSILALGVNIYTMTFLIALFQSKEIKPNSNEYKRICKLVEIILFTKKFIGKSTRTNHLDNIARMLLENSEAAAIKELEKYAREGFRNWKQENQFKDFFNIETIITKDFYNNDSYATKYLLWKYENSLRTGLNDSKSDKIIHLKDFWSKEGNFHSIEHIYPKNPDLSEKLENNYLHNIGNLLAINLPENIRKSNKPVKEKYEEHFTTLAHHQELQRILKDEEKGLENFHFNWGETPEDMQKVIEYRAKKIAQFALEYFSIDNNTSIY